MAPELVRSYLSHHSASDVDTGFLMYLSSLQQVAGVAPDSTNIIFHPFLYGSNVQPTARAGFYGVAGWHTRAHLLRALYEGVAFGHLSHIEKLRTAGAQINSARLAGGGSRSPVWSQIFSDTIQVPMEVPDGNELGARGAALSAKPKWIPGFAGR